MMPWKPEFQIFIAAAASFAIFHAAMLISTHI
jgi:hypothetical protein